MQFVVCSNDASGILGEHTMLDALTLNELLDDQVTAIRTHEPVDVRTMSRKTTLAPVFLPLMTHTELDTRIMKVGTEFATSTASI